MKWNNKINDFKKYLNKNDKDEEKQKQKPQKMHMNKIMCVY